MEKIMDGERWREGIVTDEVDELVLVFEALSQEGADLIENQELGAAVVNFGKIMLGPDAYAQAFQDIIGSFPTESQKQIKHQLKRRFRRDGSPTQDKDGYEPLRIWLQI